MRRRATLSGIRRNLLALIGAAACMIAVPTFAAQCTISTAGLAFGVYDPFSTEPLDSIGTISVSCDEAVPYTIALSPGNGSYSARRLVNGLYSLIYNLYVARDGSPSGATAQPVPSQ